MRSQPLALDDILGFVPLSEKTDDNQKVSLWYAQSESMVQFMIERGGRIGFGQFLAALRQNESLDKAVADGFPGMWRDSAELLQAWTALQP